MSSGDDPPKTLPGDGSVVRQAPVSKAPPSTKGIGIGLIGVVIAAWGAMCGIGGGLFAVPILHYVYKLTLKEAIVTSLALVAATTISATFAELLHADNGLDWRIILALIVCSLVGAQLGFRVAKVVSARKLKLVFAIALTFVGVRLLGLVPEPEAADGGLYVLEGLETRDFWLAGAIGFGGGFVAPLLGIGGGLVAVPALMMFVPALGHLGARACSMAMATITSTRSMFLYYRAGQLDLGRSASFAIGAGIGAFLGVQLVHIPGVSVWAEKMLAATLLIVAFRFALDVLRKAPPKAKSGPAVD